MSVILYALLTTALYYLGSRAIVTSWLWNRYPQRLARFMDCSACTAFWWGTGIHLTIGRYYDIAYLSLNSHDLPTSILVGLCSLAVTPIVVGLMQQGFERGGTSISDDHDQA